MKEKIKYLICVVIVAVIACNLLSCKNNAAEKNLEKYGDKEPMVNYAILGRAANTADLLSISDELSYSFELEVAADTFLTKLSIKAQATDETAKINVKIQKWDETREDTQKGKAIYKTDVSVDTYRYYEANIENGLIGEGKYLVTLTAKDGEAQIRYSFAYNRIEEEYAVTMGKTYYNGTELEFDLVGFATYNSYNETVNIVNTEKTKLTEGKAKVILIMGQSNASGQTYTRFVKENVSEEKYAEYEKGYDNVLIYNNVDGGLNETNGFVPVKLGLGGGTDRIGPELGLADYLSKQYPDETIYIIKSSWSGAGLTAHFNENANEYKWVVERIQKAIAALEKDNVDFEIAALLWMQGETDAYTESHALDYANQERDFIARISEVVKDYLPENGFVFEDAAISCTNGWLYYQVVNVAKQQVCQENVNYYYVDTVAEGLQCERENNDICHYDSTDEIRLGEMFGETFTKAFEN